MSLLRRALRRSALLILPTIAPFVFVTSDAVAAAAKVQTVAIRNFAFAPQVIVVTPGTTVTWTNADEDPHTVTANDKDFRSAALDSGDTYSFTFAEPGTFAYFCSLHPHMTGKVIVQDR